MLHLVGSCIDRGSSLNDQIKSLAIAHSRCPVSGEQVYAREDSDRQWYPRGDQEGESAISMAFCLLLVNMTASSQKVYKVVLINLKQHLNLASRVLHGHGECEFDIVSWCHFRVRLKA